MILKKVVNILCLHEIFHLKLALRENNGTSLKSETVLRRVITAEELL